MAQVDKIDSLESLLETTYKEQGDNRDTARVRVLVDLAKLSIRVDPDRSLDYSKEALRLSIRQGIQAISGGNLQCNRNSLSLKG